MRHQQKFHYRSSIALVAAGLLIAACGSSSSGGSSATTAAPTTAAGGTDTTAAAPTTAAAGQPSDLSGSIQWQTDWTIDQAVAFIKEFNKAYPKITVNYTRSDDAEFVDKFNAEAATGNVREDVITVGYDGYFKDWDSKGYLLHYKSKEGEQLPEKFRDPNGAYYVNAQLVTGICVNTDVLKAKGIAEPTSWEDLNKPEFKGQIVMQDILKVGSGANAMLINLKGYWTKDGADTSQNSRWENFFKTLGTQKVTMQPSYTEAQQQLVSGNFAAMPVCYPDFIQPSIEKGAPVKWLAADPVIQVLFGQGIPTGAKNVEQAQAFQDFSLSLAGQQALVSIVGQVPTRDGVDYPAIAKGAQGIGAYVALGTTWSANENKCCIQQYTDQAKQWFGLP